MKAPLSGQSLRGLRAGALPGGPGARASKSLGQPVLVDNRPGGGGAIAASSVAASPAEAAWSKPRLPAPVRSEACAMPAHHRLRPDDGKRITAFGNNLPTISDSNATRVETARTRPKIDLMRPNILPSMHGSILRATPAGSNLR